jgi:hypothetical protein
MTVKKEKKSSDLERVKKFLVAVGMKAHLSSFVENQVTHAMLTQLTNNKLKDLGVHKLGQRKTFLAAAKKNNALRERKVVALAEASSTGEGAGLLPGKRPTLSQRDRDSDYRTKHAIRIEGDGIDSTGKPTATKYFAPSPIATLEAAPFSSDLVAVLLQTGFTEPVTAR